MRLNAKLVMIMVSLLIIAVCALFILNQYSQNDLVNEIQESSSEVSKAIQISVADLTSEEEFSSRLKEYMKEAKQKGINEVSIISNEGEIIDSSDPEKVGKRRDIRKLGKGLKASRPRKGKQKPVIDSSRPYDMVVPVIVGDEQLGYVHINLLLDNIRNIQHDNFAHRLTVTFLVFMLGIILTIFLARHYTRPIKQIVESVKKVSAGDLSETFPATSRDEIGELASNFNEMVKKLREKELLEKRLYEAEHLSKVGQLASGIAHEIRNPLNYISLAVDHLKNDLIPSTPETEAESRELLDKIKEEVRRVNYMVLNFMSYGRPLKLRLSSLSCGELLEKVLPALKDRLEEQRITLAFEIQEDLPELRADPELLRTCLMNLITNAAQSMPEGGKITLGASFDPELRLFRITCADEGKGISPEDMDRITQPYFTTKEAGIGLGLAITERIVTEHGGKLEVDSTVGKGSLFSLILPEPGKEQEI
ncbi:MAG: Sensor protein ZraS [Syntrophus sp. PtaB.Bin138]|nr:MAG: Sensor protein ZraS [Syntrophus sp. PtaB.Bin138]